jgi:hypothetical protein
MSDFRRDFEDNDDDDFNLDDNNFDFGDEGDTGAAGGDFDFGDEEEGEFAFEEEPLGLDEEIPELDEVEEEREGGISRPFLIIAALMILLFIGGLLAVLFLAGQPRPPTDIELSATAIVLTNEAVLIALNQTATQAIIVGQTQTAIALQPTLTPTFTPSPRPPTVTPTPPPDLTEQAATALAVQAMTLTSEAMTAAAVTPTAPAPSIGDVQLTATALALLLQQPGVGGGPTPTPEVLGTPGTPAAPRPTALPQTGFFDDVMAGSISSMGALALMALGLVGVIVVSRRLRAANNR